MQEAGSIKFNVFPFYTTFNYYSLYNDPVLIDLSTFDFNLTKIADDGTPVVYMKLPMIRSWNFTFDYDYKMFGIHFGGNMKIESKGINAICAVVLKATDRGFLFP